MLTLRLDKELEAEIEKISKSEGISKSELIRKTITEYMKKRMKPTLYTIGKEMFEKYSLKDKTLSRNSEKILMDYFKNAKSSN